jgi:hypothetical protein
MNGLVPRCGALSYRHWASLGQARRDVVRRGVKFVKF